MDAGGGARIDFLGGIAISIILSDPHEFVRRYINDNCIARVPLGSKAMPSYRNQGNGYYTWQFYLREALFNPVVLNIVVRDFITQHEELLKSGEFQLCGVESASTPLLTAIAIACWHRGLNVNIFSIRKEQKPYGKRNWLEGRVLQDKLAMMVDDLISQGHKTCIHAAAVLHNQGIPVAKCCYAMVHKTAFPQSNKIKLLGQEITVSSMFNLNHFDLELEDYLKKKNLYPWS
jgi:orotate phosphoribosyltransferase